MNRFCIWIAMTAAVLLTALPAHAHKVTVFGWVEGDTVHTESKFSGGKRVNAGKIEVFNQNNEKLLEGITDGRGAFSFPKPAGARELVIVLVAGMGHTNHWKITSEELGTAAVEEPETARPLEGQPDGPDRAEPIDGSSLSAEAVERIVARVVEKKLAPLQARIAEQAWGLRDIVAGIGYILGLMGLASYLHYRKTEKGRNDNPK